MLHILWMIIKFILIILGIVLGLVLLALLLILFCPVRYQAQVQKKAEDSLKEIQAQAKVSWLFRGISFKVIFNGGEVGYSVRLLGIPLDKLKRKKKETESKPGKVHKEAVPKKKSIEKPTEMKAAKKAAEALDIPENDFGQEKDWVAVQELDTQIEPVVSEESVKKSSPAELIHTIWEKLKKILGFPVRIFRKIIAMPGIILEKIRKITLTIHNICDKIEEWKAFINHPRTKAAIALVKKEAKGLICHILPTKVTGELLFGSENPATTGTVLAILGMTIPFHKNCIAVTPSFEGENILSGRVALKGRIYGFMFVKTAVQIYFNKNIKFVINRWKTRRAK